MIAFHLRKVNWMVDWLYFFNLKSSNLLNVLDIYFNFSSIMTDVHCDAKTAHCNKIISQKIKLDVAGWSRGALPIPVNKYSAGQKRTTTTTNKERVHSMAKSWYWSNYGDIIQKGF